jgi:hypothetical protein
MSLDIIRQIAMNGGAVDPAAGAAKMVSDFRTGVLEQFR